MNFENLVQVIDPNAVITGNSVKVRCPAHADKKESLSISLKQDRILLYCHAGCDVHDILRIAGLEMNDLFLDDNGHRKSKTPVSHDAWKAYFERKGRKIIDTYEYRKVPNDTYAFTRIRYSTDKSKKEFVYHVIRDGYILYDVKIDRADMPSIYPSTRSVKEAIEQGKTIFYVEGEKDVNTLVKMGYTAITTGSADDWKKSSSLLLPLFTGADVVVLADNDIAGIKSAKKVADDIRPGAKSVRLIRPTPWIEKGDITDYFESGKTKEDFESLLNGDDNSAMADMVTSNIITGRQADEAFFIDGHEDCRIFHLFDDSGKVSKLNDIAIVEYLLKEEHFFIMGGIPYLYRNGYFSCDKAEAYLKNRIRSVICPSQNNSNTIKRVYQLIFSYGDRVKTLDELNAYPSSWINFRNGMYDPVGREFHPHSPDYFSLNQVPHSYDPDSYKEGTLIEDWLNRYVCPAPDAREMFLQYAGYCMTADSSRQVFLFLRGVPRSGKSSAINLIEAMVGTENHSSLSLEQFGERFTAFSLVGKLLNSCADVSSKALNDVSLLKRITGADTITAEQKGKDAFPFKPYAKLLFSCNELPIVNGERTHAIYDRSLFLSMDTPVPEEERFPDFDKLLIDEIDYFIDICVKALGRMYESGRGIIPSADTLEVRSRLQRESDTTEAWLQSGYVLVGGDDYRIKTSVAFYEYDRFCQEEGRTALTKMKFFKALQEKGFSKVKYNGDEHFRRIKLN